MKKLRFISFAILATALIVVSCPRPTDTPEVPGNVQKAEEKKDSPSGIQIKISGDERIDNTSLPAQTAIKGQKWKDVKTSIEEKVKLSYGWNNGDYHIYQWRLGNENGTLLSDDYKFTTNTTIYAVTNYAKFNLVENGTAIDEYKGYLGEKPRGKIIIPEGVTKINGGDRSGAFSGCSGLTSLTLPDGLTSIGIGAFVDCSGLTSIDLSACTKLTSIEWGAFYDCSGLTSIDLSACTKLTSIEYNTFAGCSGLTSITLPDGLTSIEYNTFAGCSGLTSITLPDGLTSIEYDTFSGCSGLTSIDLSACTKLTSIGNGAFYDCSGLTSITLPDGLTSIGHYAFEGCSKLTSVTFTNRNGWAVYDDQNYKNKHADISSSGLDDTAKAADLLTTTYKDKYWKRN
ncbi:leucine-rich repeat protein [Treponema phagedenis]|uniref:leucine-rich repeat domain-containing protein n=1 Tax=Treponema phagedenis TaxID=162 RepID=UPI0011E75775|nr:leucine-rich repeat domain-containing protein [Treponema phagedenis]QEJ95750.1 leucine-rich repeat protein [Treponema phagedenis]